MLYDVTAHPLLAAPDSKFQKLKTDAEREAQNLLAELLLDLRAPAYTDDAATELGYAVALQVAFQLEQGYTPEIVRSQSRSTPGDGTSYRDRYLHPGAAAIVSRVTGATPVGFTATLRGV
jgi:hypothetical protein